HISLLASPARVSHLPVCTWGCGASGRLGRRVILGVSIKTLACGVRRTLGDRLAVGVSDRSLRKLQRGSRVNLGQLTLIRSLVRVVLRLPHQLVREGTQLVAKRQPEHLFLEGNLIL